MDIPDYERVLDKIFIDINNHNTAKTLKIMTLDRLALIHRKDVCDTVIQENESEIDLKTKTIPKSIFRKVDITRIRDCTKRVVPLCSRHRCRKAHFYRRISSKNIKYKQMETLRKKKSQCKTSSDRGTETLREECNPITMESNEYADQCINNSDSFTPVSTDSDELEELIKTTRKRIKEGHIALNIKAVSSYSCMTSIDENISPDDETSLHSMDTVVLNYKGPMPYSPINCQYSYDNKYTEHNSEGILCNNYYDDVQIKLEGSSNQQIKEEWSPIY